MHTSCHQREASCESAQEKEHGRLGHKEFDEFGENAEGVGPPEHSKGIRGLRG